jgi:hypothetical protein
MNSVEKDNIIQKAICCSGNFAKKVADMYINGNPCAYNEFQKLFLLISYTETLGCYDAPLEETTYVYTIVNGVPTVTPTTVTTEYTNCLSEDQADSIANNIALICDLCDEH